jgi:hypothetical protein
MKKGQIVTRWFNGWNLIFEVKETQIVRWEDRNIVSHDTFYLEKWITLVDNGPYLVPESCDELPQDIIKK